MHVTPSARTLIAGLSLAVLAGCASTSGTSTQDDAMTSARQNAYGAQGSGVTTTGLSGNQISATPYGRNAGDAEQSFDDSQAPELRTIYFAYDSDRIRTNFANALYDHAEYLKAHSEARLELMGHTDNRGTREYNMALGERRALSVKRFLMMLEVPDEQVATISYGEERPAARGNNEDAYAQNRRVILEY